MSETVTIKWDTTGSSSNPPEIKVDINVRVVPVVPDGFFKGITGAVQEALKAQAAPNFPGTPIPIAFTVGNIDALLLGAVGLVGGLIAANVPSLDVGQRIERRRKQKFESRFGGGSDQGSAPPRMKDAGSSGQPEIRKQVNRQIKLFSKEFNADSQELGKAIADGIIKGLQARQVALNTETKRFFGLITRTAKTTLEISSPSRVMMRLGRAVGEGLEQGLKQGQGGVSAAARRLARAAAGLSGAKASAIRTGRQIGDGLAAGIRQSRGQVAAAMRSVTQPVASSAATASAGLKPMNKELAATSKEATKSGRQMGTATKGLKGIGPAGKIAGTGLKGVGAGFKAALGPAGLILMLLEPFLTQLIETVTRSKKFKQAVEVAMKGVSIAVGWVSKVIKGIFDWVKKNWKKLLPLLLGPFGAVIAGVLIFRKQITAGIEWVINWVKNNWKLLLAILTGPFGLAIAFVIKFRGRIGGVISSVINWIKGHWRGLLAILVWPFKVGASAVVGVFGRIVSYARGLPGRIRGAIGSVGGVLRDKGADLIRGLINGIKSQAGAIVAAIKSYVTDKIPAFIRNRFSMSSPSKLMMELGRHVSDGMALGIEAGARNVDDAMAGLVSVPRIGAGAYASHLRRGDAQRKYEFHFHGPVTDPEETSRQFASRLREWEVLNAAS
ncbi:phage tail protein [Actinomadura spongiicola]|uniref:phage tail protein n=1 Tax=Actinomadura spongiicola TaxID=2303421 RepID=UPI001314BE5C|nr:hypothetical protein [Actinomadura spongiicola]